MECNTGKALLWVDSSIDFLGAVEAYLHAIRKDIRLLLAENEIQAYLAMREENVGAIITNLMIPSMNGAVLVRDLENLIAEGRWSGSIAMITKNPKEALDYLGRNNVEKEIPIFSKPITTPKLHEILAKVGFGFSSPVALQSLATSPRGVGNA